MKIINWTGQTSVIFFVEYTINYNFSVFQLFILFIFIYASSFHFFLYKKKLKNATACFGGFGCENIYILN